MSSAILYLAIVAIWAFMLVPRWLRRSHAAPLTGAHAAGDADPAAEYTAVAPGGESLGGESLGGEGPGGEGPGGEGPGGDDQPEPDTAPVPVVTDPRPALAEAPVRHSSPATAGLAGRPQPSLSRGKVLQARRRLLTILILLAVAAVSCTALGLTSGWVCVPPAGMLGMYLLLLREAALADAENVRWRAEQAHAARQRTEEQAAARATLAPQPTAQVIDISDRLGDQLYDQYADATMRAVGD